MCAVKTPLTEIDSGSLKNVLQQTRDTIPVGFKHHEKLQDQKLMPYTPVPNEIDLIQEYPVIVKEFASALKQLGTLGGGKAIASRPRE
jgi:tRNA-splicing ligase RtcB